MLPKISKITELKENTSTVTLFDSLNQFPISLLTNTESKYLKDKLEKDNHCTVYRHPNFLFFNKIKEENEKYLQKEEARKAGS